MSYYYRKQKSGVLKPKWTIYRNWGYNNSRDTNIFAFHGAFNVKLNRRIYCFIHVVEHLHLDFLVTADIVLIHTNHLWHLARSGFKWNWV